MMSPDGQTRSGYLTSVSKNPKSQPGSASIMSTVTTGDGSDIDSITDNYPQMTSTNSMDRGRPQAEGQNERGYGQAKPGSTTTKNTSAGRVRTIPSP